MAIRFAVINTSAICSSSISRISANAVSAGAISARRKRFFIKKVARRRPQRIMSGKGNTNKEAHAQSVHLAVPGGVNETADKLRAFAITPSDRQQLAWSLFY